MNHQTRAFQISFLLHGVIIALVIIGNTYVGQYRKVMVLDFDLQKPASRVQKGVPPSTQFVKTNSLNSAAHERLKEKEPPLLTEEGSKILATPETPLAVKRPETHNLESRSMEIGIKTSAGTVKEVSSGIALSTKEESEANSGNSKVGGKESTRAKYLNDNFAYIRDKILRNVSYPDAARRMGCQGKVLLSFIITAKGSVREFKIIKSSGFPVLDRCAIDTVKNTAPFPKPPVEAQLVIPIVYRLE